MYYYSAFNAWLPKQLHINIIYRGRLTSSWWYHFSRENLARSHSDDISSEIVLISHCLYRMNVRGAVLNEILHCVNIIYRGRLTSTWWYHFWRGNLARSHSDDISSENVLISHCLYRMNVCLYSVIVLLLGKFNGGEVEVVGGAGIKQTPWWQHYLCPAIAARQQYYHLS